MILFRSLYFVALTFCVMPIYLAAFVPEIKSSLPVNFDAIDRYIEEQMKSTKIPGAALAIVKGDSILHIRGFGIADPSGRPVTPETPFVLGSTTKSFTALAIMQLVEKGKIELDLPVQYYLPWFRVADPKASAQITVRHLVNHTSGLTESEGRKGLADRDTSAGALEKHARVLRKARLRGKVGTRFEYSNSNYIILGNIIQEVSGMSYETYIEQHIFDPLNMKHSFTSQKEAEQNGMAVGYRKWFGYSKPSPDMPFVRGVISAGYLITSARDMAQYLIAHLNEGRYAGKLVISPAGMAELLRPTARMDEKWSYAMGWVTGKMQEEMTIWHNGGTPSFYTYMAILPESRMGMVMLMNMDNLLKANELEIIPYRVIDMLRDRETDLSLFETDFGFLIGLYGLACLPFIIQLLWISYSIAKRPWGASQKVLSSYWHKKVLWICTPLLLNLAWAAGIFFLFWDSVVSHYAPDLAFVLLISAAVAVIWGVVQSGIRIWAIGASEAEPIGEIGI